VIFASIFLAELGDKTQLATIVFSADPAVSRAGVFAAAAGALVASALLAVLIGASLGQWLAPSRLKVIAGLGFIAIGIWMLVARQ